MVAGRCSCRWPTPAGTSASSALGFWCAIAVAVLGLLGSLKALLTGRDGADALVGDEGAVGAGDLHGLHQVEPHAGELEGRAS